jgi:hypothetical protein
MRVAAARATVARVSDALAPPAGEQVVDIETILKTQAEKAKASSEYRATRIVRHDHCPQPP